MGKSRHTKAKGLLTRSLGVNENVDLVAGIDAAGHFVIREEPTDRKLKRNEKLPEVKLDIRQLWEDSGRGTTCVESSIDEFGELLDEIIRRMPIAKFEEGPPSKIHYRAKFWILQELKYLREARSSI